MAFIIYSFGKISIGQFLGGFAVTAALRRHQHMLMEEQYKKQNPLVNVTFGTYITLRRKIIMEDSDEKYGCNNYEAEVRI